MLLMKNIIKEGNPILYAKAADVTIPLSDEDKEIAQSMHEFIENSQDEETSKKYGLRPGVGLAAPQIAVSKKIVIIKTLDEKFEKLYDLCIINPKIISHSTEKTYLDGGEGCLSVDREVEGLVPRYNKIKFSCILYDITTKTYKEVIIKLKGYLSIVFQHENDHLNGILFVDRIDNNVLNMDPIEFSIDDDKFESAE